MRRFLAVVVVGVFLPLAISARSASTSADETAHAATAAAKPSAAPANDASDAAAISADGRFVVFESLASNLVAGDTNRCRAVDNAPHKSCQDVFVRDRLKGTTERVSVSSSGRQANYSSADPAISADGRFVVFDSGASNLVAGNTNRGWDVFVRDRLKRTTERVSVSSSGRQANNVSRRPAISADGRFVVFESLASNLVAGDTNKCRYDPIDPYHNCSDVFVRDLLKGTTERVSVSSSGRQARGESYEQTISADGRFVAFYSQASNLVAGDTNGQPDVFVRDRLKRTTERVSVSTRGRQANYFSADPAISADGRFVVFDSGASNLVAGDTNGQPDVFVRDRLKRTTERLSVSNDGNPPNGVSSGGLISAISADGRFVVFDSLASNLVAGDRMHTDVFVRDRLKNTTERLSLSASGRQANGESERPAISADGRFVAFQSEASNLVSGDTNSAVDVFVRDRKAGKTKLVSVGRRRSREVRELLPSREPWADGGSRSGRTSRAPSAPTCASNSLPEKPLSASTSWPGASVRSSISQATRRSGWLAAASSKPIGMPSEAASR
jgi:Tol biopolymer transport system component